MLGTVQEMVAILLDASTSLVPEKVGAQGCDVETSEDDIKTFCSSNVVMVKACE